MPEALPNANKVALLPEPTTLDAPFWDGLRAGELQLQHCAACGAFQYPAETFCYECGGTDLPWEATSGGGKIGRAHAELQSLMRISYAVFCLKKKKKTNKQSIY